jgi:hypothetical protein
VKAVKSYGGEGLAERRDEGQKASFGLFQYILI